MSTEITTAFIKQYSDNIDFLAQQKGSKLRNCVRVEDSMGEEHYIDQIGAATAQEVFDRHGDSPQNDTPHSRRQITPRMFDWGELYDKFDKVRTLIDPTSAYAKAGGYALGRQIDQLILAAATGDAKTDKTGSTTTSHPASQQLSAAALTVDRLIEARTLFLDNDVDLEDPENQLYCALTGQQFENLLKETEVQSADYNTVKALVKGEIDTFLGVKFIHTELVEHDSTNDYDTCPMWAKSGIALGIFQDVQGEITQRADKRFSWYAYASMVMGATRTEEVKVVDIQCDRSP